MGKTKKTTVPEEERRTSIRLRDKSKLAPLEKKKPPARRPAKVKKPKQAENGNTKAEEPKTEVTDAK